MTNGKNHIVIAKSGGKAVHFNEVDVRPMGRTASGVRGVTLDSGDDKVVFTIGHGSFQQSVAFVNSDSSNAICPWS